MYVYTRCCIFFAESPPTQRSTLLTCFSLAQRDREKEKSVEFANGSLLKSDSRIFVQHLGAFPLFRTHLSSSVFLASLLPLISLFQSSTIPRHRRTSSSSLSTLLFLGSFYSGLIFSLSLPVLMLRIFLFAF